MANIATIVFSLLALMSFIAYQIGNRLPGKTANNVTDIAWHWVMPLAFIAAAFSSAF